MSINKMIAGLAIAAVLLAVPSEFIAQDARGKLASAKSLKCTFPLVATGTWGPDQPKAR